MKDFRGMKRQRSRNRKPSGNQNNPNRAYESNGPEGTKVRGNAQTIYERYQQLARDANSSGDRVLAENHLQHAEHYFRMIRQMQPQRPVSEFVQRDPFSSGLDDYDEENDNEASETDSEAVVDDSFQNEERPRFENRNNGNGGNNRDRDNRDGNRDRDRNRQNNNQNNGNNRDGRDRYNNGEQRSFEPRNNNPVNGAAPVNGSPPLNGDDGDFEGGRRETRRERYERRRAQRLNEQELNVNGVVPVAAPVSPGFIASTEPLGGRPIQSGPSELAPAPVAEQPQIQAAIQAPVRERRERAPRAETRSEGVDADHLPAFIRKPAPIAAAEPAPAEVEKPKRGRKPKVADVGAAEEA